MNATVQAMYKYINYLDTRVVGTGGARGARASLIFEMNAQKFD